MSPVPTCSIKACGREAKAHGLCQIHYMRQRRGLPLEAPVRERREGAQLVHVATRVESDCAEALESEAKSSKRSVYDVAADVLETWAKRRKRKT